MKRKDTDPNVASRLSRKENRALTRSRLLSVGREHFLAKGFAGTILEQIAEEAGFSRGALYSNFSGKEDLFLAVFDSDLHLHLLQYHQILDGPMVAEHRVQALRTAFIDHVTDRDWGILRTEFELGALRSEALRKRFIQIHRRDLDNAIALAQKAVDTGDLELSVPVDEFVLAAQSFMMGLSLKQRLLGRDFPSEKIREIAGIFFDICIAAHMTFGGSYRRVRTPR